MADCARLSDAGRVGAARGDLALVAPQPRQLARRIRRRRARDERVRPRARRVRARVHQRARRSARAPRPRAARESRAARTAALLPISDERRVVPRSRRRLRDAPGCRSPGSRWTSTTTRGAGSTRRSTAIARRPADGRGVAGAALRAARHRARGRLDRGERRGRAAHDRAVPAQPEPQPGARAATTSSACCATRSA